MWDEWPQGEYNFAFLKFFWGDHAAWHMRSHFLDQGWNPGPMQCKPRVLTTGMPGNSHISLSNATKSWVDQKVPSALEKKKRHFFHFYPQLYWTRYLLFCSTTFCHFSGNFIISFSQNVLSFWTKNYSGCPLQFSRELKFFPIGEFCNDQNKCAMSGEYGQWIRTSKPSYNSFCLVIKATCSLALS